MNKLLLNVEIEEILPILTIQDPDHIRLKELYKKSIENFSIDISSCLTIRDLNELSGCNDWQIHIILILMFKAVKNGSLCIGINNLERLLDSADTHPKIYKSHTELAGQIKKWIISNSQSIISENNYTPLIISGNENSRRIYFHLFYINEKSLVEGIVRLIDQKNVELTSNNIKQITTVLKDVIEDNPAAINESPVILNKEQKIAVTIALLQNFTIISGGPGTGKTSITSSIIRALVKLGYNPDLIALCAPTGRAAQRLAHSINLYTKNINGNSDTLNNIKASTIHRLLGYNPIYNTFIYNSKNQLPYRVIIIDEVSMADLVLMANLIKAIYPENTKLILIGDKNQLPSVNAGAVLSDLLPSDKSPGFSNKMSEIVNTILPDVKIKPIKNNSRLTDMAIILKHSYRSEKNILRFAASINAQKPVSLKGETPLWFEKEKDCEALPVLDIKTDNKLTTIVWPKQSITQEGISCGKLSCVRIMPEDKNSGEYRYFNKMILSWVLQQYLKKPSKEKLSYSEILIKIKGEDFLDLTENKNNLDELFAGLTQSRILTFFNHGNYGITGINSTITSMIREEFDKNSTGIYYHGLPIMITRNDYKHELFNGDMGVVLKVKTDKKNNSYRVFFRRGNKYLSYPLDNLPESKPAFAITVHKSQGSEFDQILLILSDDSDNPLLSRQILYTGLTRAKYLCVLYGSNEVIKTAINNSFERETGISL